jgi:solute carrier family 23 (nucleobase transporter), member 1
VDLKLSRNITIIGIAVMCGMYIPEYFDRFPIKTSSTDINQTLSILLHIRMIIGGFIAFILDNLVPGNMVFHKQNFFHIIRF